MRVLVTGGAGYVGSHTCVALLENDYDVVVVDSLVNGSREALRRVEEIAGRPLAFHEADIRDRARLDGILAESPVDAVLHFAALKAVGESVEDPLAYFDNNVGGTVTLCQSMRAAQVRTIVFSSSATVYGVPDEVPIGEDAPLSAVNPYGRTKLMSEQILADLQVAWPALRVGLLRYFNPGGAHPGGRIGESPKSIPNNLLPYIARVAVGDLPYLRVFGGDYPTPDGTGVRDYIHIMDLARGHVAALERLLDAGGAYADGGVLTVNLGTGRGYSVLEVLDAFERAVGRELPYRVVDRRPGDVAECYAAPSLAARVLGWRAEFGIDRICEDAWRWQSNNPHGFDT